MPCTPPPGGVAALQMKTPGVGVVYGEILAAGRVNSWPRLKIPPLMSPPARLALCASMAAVSMAWRPAIMSRNPGAKRSTWDSMASVLSTRDPLGEDHEWALRVPAGGDGGFGGDDLLEAAAEMHGAGGRAARVPPRDGAVQRPVELEHAGAVAVAAQPAAIPLWQRVAAEPLDIARNQVEDPHPRRRKIGERGHAASRFDRATELGQAGGEGGGDVGCATADHGPARRVCHQGKH